MIAASDFSPPLPSFPIPNIYLPLWYLFLVFVGIYMERRTHWFTRFNIFTVLMVSMFVRYGIAVPFSDGILPASSTQTPISTSQLLSWYAALTLTYIGIVAGVELVYRWRGNLPGPDLRAGPPAAETRAVAGLAAVLIGVVALVWIVLPWNDVLETFGAAFAPGHTAAQYRAHRDSYGLATHYAGSVLNYAGSFTRFAVLPGVLWVLWFQRAQSWALKGLFWFTLGFLGLIGLASGEKMPALLLVLGFIFALVLGSGARSIFTWRLSAIALLGVLIVIPVLYHFQVPTWNYLQLLTGSVYRETIEYSRVAQLRFAFYPDLHSFLYGQSSFVISGLERLLGFGSSSSLAPQFYIPAHSTGVGAGYAGTWNAGFFAEAWADFGFVGVIVEAVVVGIFVAAIDRWYQQGPKGPLQMGTYTALCVAVLYLTEVSLLTALWTFGLASLFLVYLVLARFPGESTHPLAQQAAVAEPLVPRQHIP